MTGRFEFTLDQILSPDWLLVGHVTICEAVIGQLRDHVTWALLGLASSMSVRPLTLAGATTLTDSVPPQFCLDTHIGDTSPHVDTCSMCAVVSFVTCILQQLCHHWSDHQLSVDTSPNRSYLLSLSPNYFP